VQNILYKQHDRVLAKIDSVKNIIATDFSGTTEASQLAINEIGEVNIKLSKAIYFDAYNDNKSNGAFILIDAATNTTAGVGFIR
jgi:sulfate adenylyltransferase subunit 1